MYEARILGKCLELARLQAARHPQRNDRLFRRRCWLVALMVLAKAMGAEDRLIGGNQYLQRIEWLSRLDWVEAEEAIDCEDGRFAQALQLALIHRWRRRVALRRGEAVSSSPPDLQRLSPYWFALERRQAGIFFIRERQQSRLEAAFTAWRSLRLYAVNRRTFEAHRLQMAWQKWQYRAGLERTAKQLALANRVGWAWHRWRGQAHGRRESRFLVGILHRLRDVRKVRLLQAWRLTLRARQSKPPKRVWLRQWQAARCRRVGAACAADIVRQTTLQRRLFYGWRGKKEQEQATLGRGTLASHTRLASRFFDHWRHAAAAKRRVSRALQKWRRRCHRRWSLRHLVSEHQQRLQRLTRFGQWRTRCLERTWRNEEALRKQALLIKRQKLRIWRALLAKQTAVLSLAQRASEEAGQRTAWQQWRARQALSKDAAYLARRRLLVESLRVWQGKARLSTVGAQAFAKWRQVHLTRIAHRKWNAHHDLPRESLHTWRLSLRQRQQARRHKWRLQALVLHCWRIDCQEAALVRAAPRCTLASAWSHWSGAVRLLRQRQLRLDMALEHQQQCRLLSRHALAYKAWEHAFHQRKLQQLRLADRLVSWPVMNLV